MLVKLLRSLSCSHFRFSQGGLKLKEFKTNFAPVIEYIESPAKIEILLLQHIGPMAKSVVDIGQYVEAQQLLAKTAEDGFLYSRIHSPMSGVVTAIQSRTLASGAKIESIVIEYEEKPVASIGNTSNPNLYSGQSQSWRKKNGGGLKEISQRIAAAGIVGMGGATFPSDIKLQLLANRKCDYLLLNAVECEPYLHSDASLLREMAIDVVGGIDVLAESLKPKYIAIGLEQSSIELTKPLKTAIQKYRNDLETKGIGAESLPPIRFVVLKNRYPQGAESQLIEAISGRRVGPGQLPQELGCLVVNVATSKAIYDAVERGLPLTRRIITVAGGAVCQPKIFNAPLGTPLDELLKRCGGFHKPVERMMNGGPLMGRSFYDLQQFVTKGSTGFLFLTAEEVAQKKQRPCIRCDACIAVCPMGLEPVAMFQNILAEKLEQAVAIGLANCIDCGACASICPSQIPLVQSFTMAKVRCQQEYL